LLAGFESDTTPAFDPLVRGPFQTSLAANGFNGHDFGDAELGGFLDHPFEMVELDERGAEDQAHGGLGRGELFNGAKRDVLLARSLNLSEVDVAVVGNFETLSGLDSENAGEVAGIVAGNFGASTAYLVDKEPAAHILSVFFMISHLRGALLEKHPNLVVVDVHGVGYEVTIPVSVFSSLPATGAEVALYIHTHVREDALSLFGFLSAADKALFEKLISVSGIGPKLAVTALSGLAAPELIGAIRTGALDQLVKIPGVGKKTAERMVLELRDKLDFIGAPARAAGASASQSSFNATEEDTISALMNFGSTRAAAEAAVTKARSAEGPNDFDALFRRALKLVR